ncbi:zf-HC2 domain-containing protein [Streptomyces sp. NRRL S-337]|uniref:zf-HC2 domain-containing protein n=1 Tax=Streptomyces sp. NRRL S-337 TaxID=1463900 RepID=UPI0007C464AC|nr:zf-HC2 domain-containing protein [Streptomyces sp. NRRL S-337]
MHCAPLRTALSARLDGEELPPGLTPRLLDEHLAGCADCRRFEARARALSVRVAHASAAAGGDPTTVEALLAGLRSRPVRPDGTARAQEEGAVGAPRAHEEGDTGGAAAG